MDADIAISIKMEINWMMPPETFIEKHIRQRKQARMDYIAANLEKLLKDHINKRLRKEG